MLLDKRQGEHVRRRKRVDPRPYLLALLIGFCILSDCRTLSSPVAEDRATRIERPKALVERNEKPRLA